MNVFREPFSREKAAAQLFRAQTEDFLAKHDKVERAARVKHMQNMHFVNAYSDHLFEKNDFGTKVERAGRVKHMQNMSFANASLDRIF